MSTPSERPLQLRNDLDALYGLFGELQIAVQGIAATQQQHGVQLAELRTGQGELRTGLTELRTGQGELRTGLTELRTGQDELRTGLTELRTEQGELRTGLTELRTGQDELRTGQDEILRLLRGRA